VSIGRKEALTMNGKAKEFVLSEMALHSKEHLKFLKALVKYEVRFLLIGGQAAIYYGVNRNTGDLDILIEPTQSNGSKLIKALLLAWKYPKLNQKSLKRNLF